MKLKYRATHKLTGEVLEGVGIAPLEAMYEKMVDAEGNTYVNQNCFDLEQEFYGDWEAVN